MGIPSLELEITKQTLETGFQVDFKIISANSMDGEIFVKKTSTGVYDRVASIWDMQYVSNTAVDGNPWFRDSEFSKSFEFEQEEFANRFVTDVKGMADRLVKTIGEDPFTGVESVDLPII